MMSSTAFSCNILTILTSQRACSVVKAGRLTDAERICIASLSDAVLCSPNLIRKKKGKSSVKTRSARSRTRQQDKKRYIACLICLIWNSTIISRGANACTDEDRDAAFKSYEIPAFRHTPESQRCPCTCLPAALATFADGPCLSPAGQEAP